MIFQSGGNPISQLQANLTSLSRIGLRPLHRLLDARGRSPRFASGFRGTGP